MDQAVNHRQIITAMSEEETMMVITRMALRSILVALAMLVAAGMLPVGATPRVAETLNVSLVDFEFVPQTIIVKLGGTITWKNNGQFSHTVTASDGSFDSGNLASDQTFITSFSQSGVFPYYCKYHGTKTGEGMHGTVIVVAEFVYLPITRR
jgi:plastocyanin